jgi:hydroxymethylbilane synthase
MLTIGSRGSKLALWQANWIASRLKELGEDARIETIKTTGDKITDVPLSKVGTKGLFTKELEEALLAGRIDFAVHSLKDMPTELPDGLTLGAIPKREDPRDAVAGARLANLGKGAKVGTSSLRRSAQIRVLRPDLRLESVRGNVDTRLRKLDEGQYDAIVLAAAGLRRLGLEGRITEFLPVDRMVPAVGQGALAVEIRDEAGEVAEICAQLNDESTHVAVTAERAVLRTLGGGCQVPIGAHAVVTLDRVSVDAVVVDPDGSRSIHRKSEGPATEAEALGIALGQVLLDSGAQEILEAVYGA